jgi:TetR/AcrR family transcriptional regulator, cholesterol catabolism regulator
VYNTQQHITQIAHDLFMRYGFKAVTVDEIAKHAGISKKTLYENFSDKDKIVYAVLDVIDAHMVEADCHICNNSDNAIQEAIGHMSMMENMLKTMNANCIPDLQKYYPASFKEFQSHKEAQRLSIIRNIKRGIKEGYYRKNLDVEFCAWHRIETIFQLLQSAEMAKNFNLIDAQIEVMQHFLFGISTLKGHELIEQHIKQFKKKK